MVFTFHELISAVEINLNGCVMMGNRLIVFSLGFITLCSVTATHQVNVTSNSEKVQHDQNKGSIGHPSKSFVSRLWDLLPSATEHHPKDKHHEEHHDVKDSDFGHHWGHWKGHDEKWDNGKLN